MSVIEAIACGKNVVATNLPITKQNVKDYPYYFESQNMSDFMDALAKAYNNPAKKNNNEYWSNYTNGACLTKLMQIFIMPEDININATPICHLTPYNEQCGIAENTAYFVDLQLQENTSVKIFAPSDGKILGKDNDFVVRNWDRSFYNYEFLLEQIISNNFRVVHIQNEFSFFRKEIGLTNLIKFLKRLKIAGLKTILTYHTFFPGNDIHYKLSQLVDASTICNRAEYNKLIDEHIAKRKAASHEAKVARKDSKAAESVPVPVPKTQPTTGAQVKATVVKTKKATK
jgi:glycosyltransferase involved in cell wall biosynthesis